jgi:hypothetical protein
MTVKVQAQVTSIQAQEARGRSARAKRASARRGALRARAQSDESKGKPNAPQESTGGENPSEEQTIGSQQEQTVPPKQEQPASPQPEQQAPASDSGNVPILTRTQVRFTALPPFHVCLQLRVQTSLPSVLRRSL